MKKAEAIRIVTTGFHLNLNNLNTIFANVGIHKDSWWLEPANKRFSQGFYFILNDENNSRLLVFKIPKNSINSSVFRQRPEKGASQIIIPLSNNKYIDRYGFDLTLFLETTKNY